MDENSVKRVFLKAQKFGTLLDATTSEFQEFAEIFVGQTREIATVLAENATLKAKILELTAKIAALEEKTETTKA